MNKNSHAVPDPAIQSSKISKEYSQLLTNFRNGDTDAFEAIYLQWRKPLYFLLKRLTGSADNAEDIVQDVFGKLWETREKIDPNQDVKFYIYLLARQSAYKLLRKEKAAKNYIESSEFDMEYYANSHELVVAKETELLAEYAIRTMPEQRREVYLLSYKDGLSPAEIAKKLNIPSKNVSDHLYHARKHIKEIITLCLLFALN